MATPSPTNCTDFSKHPGVRHTKSGKWGAAIRHPITRVSVWLGTYRTPKEAADAYTKKKLEYKSALHGMAAQALGNLGATERVRKTPGSLTADEGEEALIRKRHDLDSMVDLEMNKRQSKVQVEVVAMESRSKEHDLDPDFCFEKIGKQSLALSDHREISSSQDNESMNGMPTRNQRNGQKATNQAVKSCRSKPPGVYQRKSGRWYAEIRNPITKSKSCVATYDTAEKAAEVLEKKRWEIASTGCAEKKHKRSNTNAEKDTQLHNTNVDSKLGSIECNAF